MRPLRALTSAMILLAGCAPGQKAVTLLEPYRCEAAKTEIDTLLAKADWAVYGPVARVRGKGVEGDLYEGSNPGRVQVQTWRVLKGAPPSRPTFRYVARWEPGYNRPFPPIGLPLVVWARPGSEPDGIGVGCIAGFTPPKTPDPPRSPPR